MSIDDIIIFINDHIRGYISTKLKVKVFKRV